MLEKDIEAQIVAYAKSRNVLCYKFSSPSNRGVPDRLLIGPSGKIGFLEVKRPGEKPTALQRHVLGALIFRSCKATWVDNLTSASEFIETLL